MRWMLLLLAGCVVEDIPEPVEPDSFYEVTRADCYEEGARQEWIVESANAPDDAVVVIEYDGAVVTGSLGAVIWGPSCSADVTVWVEPA